MHKRNRICLFIRFALVALPVVVAQAETSPGVSPELTLDQALRDAGVNSPKLKKSEALYDEMRWHQKEALSGFLPNLTLTGNYLFERRLQYNDLVFGGAPAHIPLILPVASTALTAMFPLFDGFQNIDRYAGSALATDAADHDQQWAKFELAQDIRFRFYQALAAERLKLVSVQNLETITDHVDQVMKLKKGGVATNFDVLRVEVQLNEAKSEVLRSEDDMTIARQRLAVAMGIPYDDHRKLQGELETPNPALVKDLKMPSLVERNDLSALQERAEAAGKTHASAAAYWAPRVSLGAQYLLYNNLSERLTDFNQYRAAWTAGIYLSWSLFDGMTSIARERQAAYQRVQADSQLTQSLLQVPTDFEFWKRRYLYNAAIYAAKQSDLEKAQESVRLSKAGFKAGVRTNTEILDAELDLFRARAGVVNALINTAEAKIKLELATGKRLN